jgi:hypothetical protein
MPYKATAQLVKGTVTVIVNGVSTVYNIDTPVQATATGLTRLLAQQNARNQCNLAAFQILHKQMAQITLTKYAKDLQKALVSTVYTPFLVNKIVDVCEV